MEAMPSIHSFLYITVGRFYPENHNSSVMEEPSVERRHRSYLWHCIQGPTSRFCKEKQPHHPIKCIGTPNIHFEVVTLTHKVGMWQFFSFNPDVMINMPTGNAASSLNTRFCRNHSLFITSNLSDLSTGQIACNNCSL